MFAMAAWREAPCFSDAALALAEAATRLSDRADPVPDETWVEAVRHYDAPALASLILAIAIAHFGNRVNATTRQVAGECECPKPSSLCDRMDVFGVSRRKTKRI